MSEKKPTNGQSPIGDENEIDLDRDLSRISSGTDKADTHSNTNEVLIMDTKNEDRTTSFFAQPGILAGKLFLL